MDWARIAFTLRYGEGRGRCLAICLSVVCVFCIASQADATTTTTAGSNETKDPGWAAGSGFPGADCSGADPSKNISVSCYGIRIVRRIVQQFLERSSQEPNLEILDGVSLVEVPASASPLRKGKFMKGFGGVGSLMQFLEGRELRIKLPALLPQNLETALQESLPVDQGSSSTRDSIRYPKYSSLLISPVCFGFSETRKRRRIRGRWRRRIPRWEERRRRRDDDAGSDDGQDDGGARIRRSRSAGHEGVDGVRVGLDALVDRGREETGERARERRRPPRGVRAGRRPPPLPEETVLHRRGGHGPSLQGIRSPVRRLEGVLIRSRTDPTGFVASSRRDSSTDTFVN